MANLLLRGHLLKDGIVINMPLGKDIGANIKELRQDNKKKGKEKGQNGKVRSEKQILAISLESARKAGADIKKKKEA